MAEQVYLSGGKLVDHTGDEVTITVGDLSTVDDLTVADDLTVSGDAAVTGAVTAASLTATGTVQAEQLTTTDDLTVTGLATVGETLAVTGIASALGGLKVGTSEGLTSGVKGIHAATVSITVPAITDPDTAPAITDVASAFTLQPTLGDPVFVVPQADLEANLALGAAHFRATDSLEVTFTSHGGNVTGGAANFTVLWFDVT